MNRRKILLMFVLALSFVLGMAGSYYMIIYPKPEVPEEFIANAKERILQSTLINADHIARDLGKTEVAIQTIAVFSEELLSSGKYLPTVESYYHNAELNESEILPLVPGRYYDLDYGQYISLNYSAYKIVPNAFIDSYQDTYLTSELENIDPLSMVNPELKSAILESAKMDIIWKEIYKTFPDLLWLYQGYEAGFHRTYPWHSLSRQYDPRVRPWYVSAATGAKDVIIIIDKSGSMEGNTIEEVKNATKSFLGSLGSSDRFNLISFSDEISKFKSSLEVASDDNIEEAIEFIDKIRTGGTTNVNEALITALKILNTYGSQEYLPVIIFITDGKPTVGVTNSNQILENIRLENSLIEAKMFLIGLGSKIDQNLMLNISSQNNGHFIQVNETNTIEIALQNYRNFLNLELVPHITWSFPFIDAAGQGLVMSAAKAVFYDGVFQGVVSADVKLESLIAKVQKFKPSPSGNAFILDVGGTTVLHPDFLNIPSDDWDVEKIRIPIEEYETGNSKFVKLKELAKRKSHGVDLVEYDSQQKIVAMTPIGNSSMIFGVSAPISELIDLFIIIEMQNLDANIETENNLFLPGIGVGIFAMIFVYLITTRKLEIKSDAPKEITEKQGTEKDVAVEELIENLEVTEE